MADYSLMVGENTPDRIEVHYSHGRKRLVIIFRKCCGTVVQFATRSDRQEAVSSENFNIPPEIEAEALKLAQEAAFKGDAEVVCRREDHFFMEVREGWLH